jgi:activator of 2-hydroxyglutaryl-CoA dehydratase
MKAAYLGIDVGSISTNLVLVDDSGRVLHKKYLRTHGQPMKAMAYPRPTYEGDAKWPHGIGSENER